MTADTMDDDWAAALQEQREAEQPPGGAEAEADFVTENEDSLLQDDDEDVDWATALEEQRETEEPPAGAARPQKQRPAHNPDSMDLLLKIPLEISVQLGDTRLLVNDLIQLGQGSIIELNKNATSEMDLYINGKLLGSGEVVVINEHFGVRIAKILTPEQRIKSLGRE